MCLFDVSIHWAVKKEMMQMYGENRTWSRGDAHISHLCSGKMHRSGAGVAASMSSRLVKKQLAALQQSRSDPGSLHHNAAAPKKKRLRPREKRKNAQKAKKVLDDQRGVDTIVLQNIKYFKSTSQSKATAQAAAVMAEVS